MATPIDPETSSYATLLAGSFLRVTGRELVCGPNIPDELYRLPFPVVSHGTQPDPIFCYANLAAQKLFGYGWDEFVEIPSRLSAEPDEREARQALLEQAGRESFVDYYSGVRVAKTGERFLISDTTLWQVIDDYGVLHGQAVVIRSWKPLAD